MQHRSYAASWKYPQSPARDKIHLYTLKLEQCPPPRFTKIFETTQKKLGLIIDLVPWVLTHQDLSGMKLAEESHRLKGHINWGQAIVPRNKERCIHNDIQLQRIGLGSRSEMLP
jgi:hypothetical protein